MTDTTPAYETTKFDLDGWTFEVRTGWDNRLGKSYFHMTAATHGKEPVKVCGPVELSGAVEEDALVHAKGWLASLQQRGGKAEITDVYPSDRPAGDVPWRAAYSVNGDTIVWDCWARIVDEKWTKISGGQISFRDPSVIQDAVRQASEHAVKIAIGGQV